MDLLGIALVAVMIIVAARALYQRRPVTRQRTRMRELVRACHGDSELAERLVFAELQRAPGLDLGEAAHRAFKRLSRERAR